MLKFIPNGCACVLDVGCHTGAFGRMLKDSGIATVWGIEADPATAAEAGRHLDHVVTGYFAQEQVPDGHFDAIVFNDVLEHIPDPSVALRIAAKKLKPEFDLAVKHDQVIGENYPQTKAFLGVWKVAAQRAVETKANKKKAEKTELAAKAAGK